MSSRLALFPVAIFGSIMGWSGLTLSFHASHEFLGLSAIFYQTLLVITLVFFGLMVLTYSLKIIKHFEAVKNEFNHPIALHFFPTISISLLLLSVLLKSDVPQIAEVLWLIGAAAQLMLTVVIINNWIHHDRWEIVHATPAWFIPVVGNIVAPLGAAQFGYMELGWFFFSIGITFWLVLKAIVLYRLIFHPFLQPQLIPTLFIFIAPPAMGFLSYMALNDYYLDNFAHVLYYAGLFITILLFAQGKRFLKVPFAISWWAYTFPLAAITNASFMMYDVTAKVEFGYLSAALIALLSGLIFHLTLKTLIVIKNKQLCVPPKA
ncbi:SLAC1 anion channel family protein [Thiomicrospira pelophila]|uniref:SLAC1 anion channel family protein n=1 Tax=Thiomicrospira pelophila TaxID=934 RepID=UPI0004A6E936|nr:SLAC1 anion channel family protein [Thiomicrospira pelophila]